MSSLQKFHRRTIKMGVSSIFNAIGDGNNTKGWYLGTAGDGISKLIVDNLNMEQYKSWYGGYTTTYLTSTTDGPGNTDALGTNSPAATQCKSSTTGGYNTWYLPAIDELNTCYQNRNAGAFGSSVYKFSANKYWSSTEAGKYAAKIINFSDGTAGTMNKVGGQCYVRPTRRVAN